MDTVQIEQARETVKQKLAACVPEREIRDFLWKSGFTQLEIDGLMKQTQQSAPQAPVAASPNLQVVEEKIKWAKTMKEEFEKNLKLLSGETIDFQATGMSKTSGYFSGAMTAIALTKCRFVFLLHKKWSSDKLLYVPLSKVRKITFNSSTFNVDKLVMDYEGGQIAFSPMVPSIGLSSSLAMANLVVNSQSKKIDRALLSQLLVALRKNLKAGVIDEASFPRECFQSFS